MNYNKISSFSCFNTKKKVAIMGKTWPSWELWYYSQIPKILKVIYYLITNYNKLFIFHFFFLSFTQHNFLFLNSNFKLKLPSSSAWSCMCLSIKKYYCTKYYLYPANIPRFNSHSFWWETKLRVGQVLPPNVRREVIILSPLQVIHYELVPLAADWRRQH